MKNIADKTTMVREPIAPIGMNFHEIFSFMFSHRLAIGVIALAVPALMGVWTFFFREAVFEAEVLMNVETQSKADEYVQRFVPYMVQERETLNKLYLIQQYFESPDFLDFVAKSFSHPEKTKARVSINRYESLVLKRYYFNELQKEPRELAAELLKNVRLIMDEERYTVTVRGHSGQPEVSAALANLVAGALQDKNFEFLVKQVRGVKLFLTKQARSTKAQLDGLESRLVSLQKQHKILAAEQIGTQANGFQMEQSQKKLELQKLKMANFLIIKTLETELEAAKQGISQGHKPSYLFLTQLQRRLELLRYQKELGHNNTNIAEVENEKIDLGIQSALNSIRQVFATRENQPLSLNPWEYVGKLENLLVEQRRKLKGIESEFNAHTESMALSAKSFMDLPDTLRSLAELQREIELTAGLYKQLQSRLQEVNIREAGRVNDLVPVSRAVVPAEPSGLSIAKKFVLAAIGGLALAFFGFLLRFIIVPTVRNQAELTDNGFFVLGSLPFFHWAKNSWSKKRISQTVVLREHSKGYESNSIRLLRFELENKLDLAVNRGTVNGQVMTVTSVKPNEGKTFATANLGYALAKSEYKVAIVDLDFKKPELISYFNEVQTQVPQTWHGDTGIEFSRREISKNLHSYSPLAMPGEPADILRGDAFLKYLSEMKLNYDLVLLDTPPLDGFLDAILVGQKSDAMLFVTHQRSTLREELYDFQHRIRRNFDGPTLALINFAYDRYPSNRREVLNQYNL